MTTDSALFVMALVLILGVLTTKFSSRLGVPSLVFYIGVGMLLSQFIYFDNAKLTQLFGTFALVVILFDGGMQTKWSNARKVALPSLSLATIGVLLTTLTVGAAAKFILDITWLEGMLFGAIVGSTDAAAVFAVLARHNIKQRITSTLEMESGTNDPMAVFLTVSLISLIQSEVSGIWGIIVNLFLQMGIGLLIGVLIGKAVVWCVNRINLDSSGLYPVFALSFAILTYSLTALLQGSGLLAVYVMATLLGNSDLTYRHSITRFNEGFAWMMQITMFILLGLLVFPVDLLRIAGEGFALALILMIVARPIGVFLSTIKMGFSLNEKYLISWAGLRGAVPIVLATYPLLAGLEVGQLFFNVVFFVVFTSALIQGSTISPLAKKLGLTGDPVQTVPYSLELIAMAKTRHEIVEIQVERGSPADGQTIQSLPFPPNSLVNAIVRNGDVITPSGATILHENDTVYVMNKKSQREEVKRLFKEPAPQVDSAEALIEGK